MREEPTRKEIVHQNLKFCKADINPVLDMAWCFLRLRPRGMIHMPLWYGFYPNLSRERSSYTTVLYSPIIDTKPVQMATMYTTRRTCKDLSIALGQHHSFKNNS